MVRNKLTPLILLFLFLMIFICKTVPGNTYLSKNQWSSNFSAEEKQTNPFFYENKYAVIIVGYYGDQQHYEWFSNDAQRQYNILNDTYGFSDENIYILMTLRDEWEESLRINQSIIDFNATEKNISMVFQLLENKITANDLLYVAVINHGGDDHHIYFKPLPIHIDLWRFIFAHDTYFALEGLTNSTQHNTILNKGFNRNSSTRFLDDFKVYDFELNAYTKNITARRIIYVLQPCFSGGFINDLSGKNHIIITSSREVQPAFASFIGYFSHGLNGSAPDQNDDDRISLGEIYEYTADMVIEWIRENPFGNQGRLQHPLIDDNGDKIGHLHKNIFCYNPEIVNKDGYIAARIFELSYEEI